VRGRVRRLGGYRKHHHVPDQHSDAAQLFVRRIAQPDVKEAADRLYRDIRELFAYKRRELHYSCEEGFACLQTPDFDLHLLADHCVDEPRDYKLTTSLVALKNDSITADPRFHACFTPHCDTLWLSFDRPIVVEDKIDAFEDIPELADALDYAPDGSSCELKLPQLDLRIELDAHSLRFSLLTLRDLGRLLERSQRAFDILAEASFGLRLR
jgi:hypothetical protein